jgi:hypothetical protein
LAGFVVSVEDLIAFFVRRPVAQRLFLAFTGGLFLACAARVSLTP